VLTSLVNTSYDPARVADPNLRRWRVEVVRRIDSMTGRALTDHWHAVTEGVASSASETMGIAPAAITVVERGRDPSRLGERTPERAAAVRAGLGISLEAPLVLAAGRQEYAKGHIDLVEAMPTVLRALPDAVALIAGREGSSSALLRDAIDRLHLAEQVRILGHRDDVPDLLAASDALALPSRYEGTAGIVIEAMAMGLPVVASDVTGLRGLVADEDNALVVAPGDPQALAASLVRVMTDAGLARRLTEAARSTYESRFVPEVNAERMVALYRSVARS
jgi:glycosyltransferase involved in cell wall biosynthesis